MRQLGTGWSTWDNWDRDRGVPILGGKGCHWDRGVFRLGRTGWDSAQVSVQMNQSTCHKVGLQGCGKISNNLSPSRESDRYRTRQVVMILI